MCACMPIVYTKKWSKVLNKMHQKSISVWKIYVIEFSLDKMIWINTMEMV